MSKRGSYLGGHTVVKAPRPWWQPEDIPLKNSGHLNAKRQAASDLDILQLFVKSERTLLGLRTKIFEAGKTDSDIAKELLISLGGDRALQTALQKLRDELPHHSEAIQKPYLELIAGAAEVKRKGVRLGRRARHAKRELKRLQFSRGQNQSGKHSE